MVFLTPEGGHVRRESRNPTSGGDATLLDIFTSNANIGFGEKIDGIFEELTSTFDNRAEYANDLFDTRQAENEIEDELSEVRKQLPE